MSSHKKHICFIGLLLLPGFSGWGQTDSIKKYRYQFSISRSSAEKSFLQKDVTKGNADTTDAIVRGYVHDYNNNPVMAASIVFYTQKDSLKKGCYSDSLGLFNLYAFYN